MPETDMSRPAFSDIAVAFALLTRLPLPRLPDAAYADQARSGWAFGLVGLAVALIAGAVGLLAMGAGLPVGVAAGLVIATQMIVTGAMHEDGLADTADGLWGGWTRERRLEIMKDSAIGTYGVLSLIVVVGLRWSALSLLLAHGIWPLIIAAMASRAVLPGIMSLMPHARSTGLSHSVGAPTAVIAALAALVGVLPALILGGPAALLPLIVALVGVVALCAIARAKIGGQTGDILGAAQQICETLILLGFVITLPQ